MRGLMRAEMLVALHADTKEGPRSLFCPTTLSDMRPAPSLGSMHLLGGGDGHRDICLAMKSQGGG